MLKWRKQPFYFNTSTPELFNVYVGKSDFGYNCNYYPKTKTLVLVTAAYDNDDLPLMFKVRDLNQASEIVEAFAKGMNFDLLNSNKENKNV